MNSDIYKPPVETPKQKKLISENEDTKAEQLDRRKKKKYSNPTGRGGGENRWSKLVPRKN